MTDAEKQILLNTYLELLNRQDLQEEELDYTVLDSYKPLLETLASMGNSGVSVFDSYKREHVFYSPNFGSLLDYDLSSIQEEVHTFIDSKIHPEDWIGLTQNGISILKLYQQFSNDEKTNYKLINEYRMLNAQEQYIRVIEQHQVLSLDPRGNIWLSLSIIDISPNQETNEGLKSQLFNFRTGKIIPFQQEEKKDIGIVLTQRETQILQLVKDGFLSKEISDKLAISIHTVNTHRQRVLEKLGANNSMEAVIFASKLGLLS